MVSAMLRRGQVLEDEAGPVAGRLVVVLHGVDQAAGARARWAASRSAGCTSGSARRARSATASRKKSPPASIRCARPSSKPMKARNLSPRWDASAAKKCSASGSPDAEQDDLQIPDRATCPARGPARRTPSATSGARSRRTAGRRACTGRPDLALQRGLARGLAGQVARSKGAGKMGIGGGIPLLEVDAVQDAAQVALAQRRSTPSRPKP